MKTSGFRFPVRLLAAAAAILMVAAAGCTNSEVTPSSSGVDDRPRKRVPMPTNAQKAQIVMTIDGEEITGEEYIPYLYAATKTAVEKYRLAYKDARTWETPFYYKDKSIEYTLAGYCHAVAQDGIVRARAVKKVMDREGILLSEDTLRELDGIVVSVSDRELKEIGCGREVFASFLEASECRELMLFNSWYGVGGSKGITSDDIKEYYETHYFSYMTCDYSLEDMSDQEKTDAINQLKQLEEYYWTDKDFEKVIAFASQSEVTDYAAFTYTPEMFSAVQNRVLGQNYFEYDMAEKIRQIPFNKTAVIQYDYTEGFPAASLVLRLPIKTFDKVNVENPEAFEVLVHQLSYDTFLEVLDQDCEKMEITIDEERMKPFDPMAFEFNV
ncbi:MAG: hypothetical protein FWE80_07045 [Oscillospiraceae bacterium]|nr:hypothetical protein [Oscillospiraceae bacterium]